MSSSPEPTPASSQPNRPNQKPNPNQNPNRARDHLANERTYLAWIRSALALLGFGVIIVRLRYFLPPEMHGHGNGWELGLVFALAGILMVVFAAVHYFHVQDSIEADSYQPSRRWIIICTVVIGMLGTGVFYYLLTSPVVSNPAALLGKHVP